MIKGFSVLRGFRVYYLHDRCDSHQIYQLPKNFLMSLRGKLGENIIPVKNSRFTQIYTSKVTCK